MRQDVEQLWRLAVAVEAAEREGQKARARRLRQRFQTMDTNISDPRDARHINPRPL
jgi:hypothetical protein